MNAAITPSSVIGHAAEIAVAWGALSTLAAEVIKQDGWSKTANTFAACAVTVITALVGALTHVPAGRSLTWAVFAGYLIWTAIGVVITYMPLLKPSGIADRLQTLTSLRPRAERPPTAPPTVPPPH